VSLDSVDRPKQFSQIRLHRNQLWLDSAYGVGIRIWLLTKDMADGVKAFYCEKDMLASTKQSQFRNQTPFQ
jgi:hypothetical protein